MSDIKVLLCRDDQFSAPDISKTVISPFFKSVHIWFLVRIWTTMPTQFF